jgi:hypothetical protein
MTANEEFAEVVRHRTQLAQAMGAVEQAAAAPIGKKSWLEDLVGSLHQLEIAWHDHTAEVQTPTGLLDRIVEEAPRLERAVTQIREAHTTLAEEIKAAIRLATDGAEPTKLRDAAVEALVAVTRHRQQGADLIYEAYDVDIGGY